MAISEIVRNTMAFVVGEGDEQKRVEIDDSEIAQTDYNGIGDGPRSDLTVTIGPADRAALLDALLSGAPTVEVDEYSGVSYADFLTREDGELVPPPGTYKLVAVPVPKEPTDG